MSITIEKAAEMLEASKPLIKWLNENCHPHVKAIVTSVDIELMEGMACEKTHEFVHG